MAKIAQLALFSWEQVEPLGDLERLQLVFDALPDEPLMQILERQRGKGRNDYPIRAVWNSLLAGIVFQHPTIETLRRELWRNGQLRNLCGFRPGHIPPPSVYTRFLQQLLEQEAAINQIFDDLVEALREVLPGFASQLAVDSKAIPSFAPHANPKTTPDGRRDVDADYGIKRYHGQHADGKPWGKLTRWFGYKIHLLVDSLYELPIAYTVTKASVADITEAPTLLDQLATRHPLAMKAARIFSADKAYDDTKLTVRLWDQDHIKPVIDIRNMWKDGESTHPLPGYDNVTFDYRGTVYCHDPVTGVQREMANGGFEKDRDTLKKICPVDVSGGVCEGSSECPVRHQVRIPLEVDRRIFTPIDRASYKWKREYAHRTAVERVNSRLDVSFGFELHTIRGLNKMRLRCGLALIVMLAMALGRIRANQPEKLRSLVQTAV